MIPLGTYLPDSPAYGQHATVASNCVPYRDYYGPFGSAVAYTDASSEAALGAFAAKASDGTPYNFIGGTAKLQLIASAAWTDVSKAGAPAYATGAEDRWYWTTFGNIVIASNGNAKLQAYTMGTSTDFDDLDTTAPVAKYVATVRGFVFAGNISSYPNRVQWSSLEDPAGAWTSSTTTQADLQDIFGDTQVGQVTQIVGGEYGTVFCENGVFRFTYVGGDLIFTNDQIIRGNGTTAPGSVQSHGEMIFFLGNDGFYMLSPAGLQPIGEGINRTFLEEVAETDYWRISSAIDPRNSLYVIAYPTTGTVLDKFLVYNWQANKWTTVEAGNMETLFTFYSEGYTLETIDALIGDPDTGPYANVSVDSSLFQGGKPSLAAVNTSHKAVLFNGEAMTATVETGEAQLSTGRKSTVTNTRPMVEGASTVTVKIGSRNSVSDAVTYSSPSTMNSEGECNIFNTGRYQRAQMTFSGGFTKAYGLDFDAVPAGKY
jgi:hypothetical protein